MSKITLGQLANLSNSTTATTLINANSTAIQTALDNTLSRDGTSPNQMGASLDMNSNRILNLPKPQTSLEPARLIDLAASGYNLPSMVLVVDTPDQTISGGANVTSKSLAAGNVALDCGLCPLQYITNNGAFTITAPTNDGSCVLLVTNGVAAGTITFSGFSVGASTGDALTTTTGNKFMVNVVRIIGSSTYAIKALQ